MNKFWCRIIIILQNKLALVIACSSANTCTEVNQKNLPPELSQDKEIWKKWSQIIYTISITEKHNNIKWASIRSLIATKAPWNIICRQTRENLCPIFSCLYWLFPDFFFFLLLFGMLFAWGLGLDWLSVNDSLLVIYLFFFFILDCSY